MAKVTTNTKQSEALALGVASPSVAEKVTIHNGENITMRAKIVMVKGLPQYRGVKYVAPATSQAPQVFDAVQTISAALVGMTGEKALQVIAASFDFVAHEQAQNSHTAKRGGGIIALANATHGQGVCKRIASIIGTSASGDYLDSIASARASLAGSVDNLTSAAHLINSSLWALGQLANVQVIAKTLPQKFILLQAKNFEV